MREGLMRYSTAIFIAIIYVLLGWIVCVPRSEAYPTTTDPVVKHTIAEAAGRVPLDAITVDVQVGPCPGVPQAAGCYDGTTGTIWILRQYRKSVSIAHELGHVFDEQLLNDGQRNRFTAILGLRPQQWDHPDIDAFSCDAVKTCANEMFADDFAGCANDIPTLTVAYHLREL